MEKIIFVLITGNVGVCLRVRSTGLVLNAVYGEKSEKHFVMELTWRSLSILVFKQTVEFVYLILKG